MKSVNFIRLIPLYFAISGIVLGTGIFSLIFWGIKPAIDFTGGSLAQVSIKNTTDALPSEASIRETLSANAIDASSIQQAGGDWIVKTKSQKEETEQKIQATLAEKFGDVSVTRFEFIGPTLGKELLIKAGVGILLSAGSIFLYIAWRFKGSKYGICADIAMIHDSLVLLGSFSLLGHFFNMEIDTLFVTAMLTILSFSVHDTIVVYDRIRESLRKFPKENFESIVNRSINETLVRSINNSLTIIFMLTALTLLGGQTIKPFALALLIGTITGTYSSTFTAAPLLVFWERIRQRKKK